MNCHEARKHLLTFADGELAVPQSDALRDHLIACPTCEQLVKHQRSLRSAVCKSMDVESTPAGLSFRLQSALSQAARKSPDTYRGGMGMRFRAFLLAACIILVAGLFPWRSLIQESGMSAVGSKTVVLVPGPAQRVADVHNQCCSHSTRHHLDSLPMELVRLGPALCANFNHRIKALAPDLGGHGYRFESANYCGILDGPESSGSHLLYTHVSKPVRLSLFSIPHWEELGASMSAYGDSKDGWRHCVVPQSDGAALGVMTWTRGGTTYVCCSVEPVSVLASMVSHIQVALVQIDEALQLACLSARE